MKRTDARQTPEDSVRPFRLAAARCSVCAGENVMILASGRNENGAIERFYCGFACASAEGWPWMTSEWHRRDGSHGQRDLFAVPVP
jgi:hypothetical protein